VRIVDRWGSEVGGDFGSGSTSSLSAARRVAADSANFDESDRTASVVVTSLKSVGNLSARSWRKGI